MEERLAASEGEQQAPFLVQLPEDPQHLGDAQLLLRGTARGIRLLAVEVVAVAAEQVAPQRDLECDIEWYAALEGRALDPGHAVLDHGAPPPACALPAGTSLSAPAAASPSRKPRTSRRTCD